MNTMPHLLHPAGQDLLGEWTSPMYSPHSGAGGGGGRLIHSLCKRHPSGSTVTLGKWGGKTVPVGNTLRPTTSCLTAPVVSNVLPRKHRHSAIGRWDLSPWRALVRAGSISPPKTPVSTPVSRWVGSKSRPPKPTSVGCKTGPGCTLRLHRQRTGFARTEWWAEVALRSEQKLSLFKAQPPPLWPGVEELLTDNLQTRGCCLGERPLCPRMQPLRGAPSISHSWHQGPGPASLLEEKLGCSGVTQTLIWSLNSPFNFLCFPSTA